MNDNLSEDLKLINSLYSKYGHPDQGAAKVFPLHKSQWCDLREP